MHSPGPKSGQTYKGEDFKMLTTDKLVAHMLFNLNRTAEMIDTLSLAVESANFAQGVEAPSQTAAESEVSKLLSADDQLFLLTTRNAVRNAELWLQAMQRNSRVMLRFQRYVDDYIGPLPL